MQQTFGQLEREILDILNGHNDPKMTTRVPRLIQKMYFKICEKASWAPLRKKIDLDFSADTSFEGIILPSELFGIDRIYDETNKVQFVMRDEGEVLDDEWGYRGYLEYVSQDPLKFFEDIIIKKGFDTFLSAELDAYIALGNDVTDEFIRIADEPGYYKITNNVSPYELDRTFYGDDQNYAEFQVRPPETKRLFIIDPAENKLADRTVTVFYWTAPRPLYKSSDTIILEDATILKLMVLREMPEAKARRPVSKSEMDDAMGEAKKLNPQYPSTQSPRDKHNNLFTFTNNLYDTRR